MSGSGRGAPTGTSWEADDRAFAETPNGSPGRRSVRRNAERFARAPKRSPTGAAESCPVEPRLRKRAAGRTRCVRFCPPPSGPRRQRRTSRRKARSPAWARWLSDLSGLNPRPYAGRTCASSLPWRRDSSQGGATRSGPCTGEGTVGAPRSGAAWGAGLSRPPRVTRTARGNRRARPCCSSWWT